MFTKFGRNYLLEIQGLDGFIHSIEYPLTLEFSVDRRPLATVNNGHFRIYNLKEDTRNQIYKDYWMVLPIRTIRLKAGYGSSLYTIFEGNLLEAKSYREEGSTNFITEIDASDMTPAVVSSFTNRTITDPISRQDLVGQLIDSLGTYTKRGAITTFEGNYQARGRVMLGRTWDILQIESDYTAFVDGKNVHCLRDNDCFSGEIPKINSDSGLLGTPKRGRLYTSVTILFEPGIQMGQIIELESSTNRLYNGSYKVYSVRHQGVISGAVGGKCKTTVELLTLNMDMLNLIPGSFAL